MSTTASTITIIVTVCGVTVASAYAMASQLGKRIDDVLIELRALRSDLTTLERSIVREHGERITRLEERL